MNELNYEKLASLYGVKAKEQIWNEHFERPGVISSIDNWNNKIVLELGAAGGRLSEMMIESGAKKVYALDNNIKMIEQINLKNALNIIPIRSDIKSIEAPPEKVDVIVASLSLHYINDWEPILEKMTSTLKDDGNIIIQVHHPDLIKRIEPDAKDNELVSDLWVKKDHKYEMFFYHKEMHTMHKFFKKANLVIEKEIINRPNKIFKKFNHKVYENLQNINHFLIFVLKKK